LRVFGINQNLDAIPRLGIVQNILKKSYYTFPSRKNQGEIEGYV
jgi:hypothetical protein